jgi:hypothetical protein
MVSEFCHGLSRKEKENFKKNQKNQFFLFLLFWSWSFSIIKIYNFARPYKSFTWLAGIVEGGAGCFVGGVQVAPVLQQLPKQLHIVWLGSCQPDRVALIIGVVHITPQPYQHLEGLDLATCTSRQRVRTPQGGSSRSEIAPGSTHDHVGLVGARSSSPTSTDQPDVEDLKAGGMGEELSAHPELG